MGRGKLVLEPIKNLKKRNLIFQTRKQCMLKKANELTTLCDVDVSIIIFSDEKEKPQLFPPNDPHKLNSLIHLYRQKRNSECGKIASFNVSDFFNQRKIKIEEQLKKAKKKNLEAKYPTWFNFFNYFSQGQLRDFTFGLEDKIDQVKTMIESHKKSLNLDNQDFHHHESPMIPMDLGFYPQELCGDMKPSSLEIIMCEDRDNNYESLQTEEFLMSEYENNNIGFEDEYNLMITQALTAHQFPMNEDHKDFSPSELTDLVFDPSELMNDEQLEYLLNQESIPDSIMEILMDDYHQR